MRSVKTRRESLLLEQTRLTDSPTDLTEAEELRLRTVRDLIDVYDTLRPLGEDGKHGDRHTPLCGCDEAKFQWNGLPPSDVVAGMAWYVDGYCDVPVLSDREKSAVVQQLVFDGVLPTEVLSEWAKSFWARRNRLSPEAADG